MKRLIELAAVVLLLAGCGHESAAKQQIRSAAAVDLACDEAAIEFVQDEPMQKRVTGCGRTLTYMSKCVSTAGGGRKCQWRPVRDPQNNLY